MRRLATQIHTTVVGVLVLFAVLLGAAWWQGPGAREESRLAEGVAETAGEVLPGPERPVEELGGALGARRRGARRPHRRAARGEPPGGPRPGRPPRARRPPRHGLGLALVRQIARAHGGDARCREREGGGTVFEVTLGA